MTKVVREKGTKIRRCELKHNFNIYNMHRIQRETINRDLGENNSPKHQNTPMYMYNTIQTIVYQYKGSRLYINRINIWIYIYIQTENHHTWKRANTYIIYSFILKQKIRVRNTIRVACTQFTLQKHYNPINTQQRGCSVSPLQCPAYLAAHSSRGHPTTSSLSDGVHARAAKEQCKMHRWILCCH